MTRTLVLCIIAVLIQLMLTLVFVPAHSIRQAIQKEWHALGRALGPQARKDILRNAESLFRMLYTDSGLLAGSYRIAEQGRRRRTGRHRPDEYRGLLRLRLDSFWANQYQLSIRLSQLLYWLPCLLALLVPSIVDGLVRRKIRSFNFRYHSAERFKLGLRLLGILLVALVLSLLFPWSVSPYWIPAAGMLLALCLMFVIANAKSAL